MVTRVVAVRSESWRFSDQRLIGEASVPRGPVQTVEQSRIWERVKSIPSCTLCNYKFWHFTLSELGRTSEHRNGILVNGCFFEKRLQGRGRSNEPRPLKYYSILVIYVVDTGG